MNLLDLMVKVGVEDQASDKMEGISTAAIAKAQVMGQAFYDAAKFVGGKALEMGKALVGGAVEGYSAYEQLSGGVAKLYGNANMSLQEYADSVGKTMDEVQGEWERNDRAQQAIMQHAQEAYKTAGMSMNDYMEQATGFSAALINSLGGDTEKAAELTDRAMRAMSDNVNTFGSDAESVQNAIMGISRGNYMMLDNLKLGFAGTKEGAEELVKAANEWGAANGEASDLSVDSFADMIVAIEQVQKAQGIYGTTGREAMSTIEGSINMTKAAWENFLTAIGSGDPELIYNAVTGILDGIFGAFNEATGEREGGIIENVLPVVQHVGDAIIGVIPSLASDIAWNLIEAFNDIFGTNFDAETIIVTIERAFQTMSDRVTAVLDGLSTAWDSFSSTVDTDYVAQMLEKLRDIGEQLWGFIESNVLPNMPTIGEALGMAANFIMEIADSLLAMMESLGPLLPAILGAMTALSVIGTLTPIITAVTSAFTFLTTVIIPALGMVQSFGGAIALVTTLLGGPVTIIAALVGALIAFIATNDEAKQFLLDAWTAVCEFFAGLPEFFAGVWESVKTGVGDFVQGVIDWWTNLKDTAALIWRYIKEIVVNAVKEKVNAAREKMHELKDLIQTKWNEIVEWVRDIPNKIRRALGNLGETLKGAGRSIIQGFLNGLKAKFEEVREWVGGIGTWIANHKGPKQYDLGLLVDNGSWIMQSLQSGLERGFEGRVKPYVEGMADELQSAISFDLASPTYSIRAVEAKQTQSQQTVTTVRDDAVIGILTAILNAIPEEVTLDSRALVGALAPDMNRALGVA